MRSRLVLYGIKILNLFVRLSKNGNLIFTLMLNKVVFKYLKFSIKLVGNMIISL